MEILLEVKRTVSVWLVSSFTGNISTHISFHGSKISPPADPDFRLIRNNALPLIDLEYP